MEQNESHYPDFPYQYAVHTQSYRIHGSMNDPYLSDFLLMRLLTASFKKRFFVGYTIKLGAVYDATSTLAELGAYIASSAGASRSELMSLTLPRTPRDESVGMRTWQYWSNVVELNFENYVSHVGQWPPNLRALTNFDFEISRSERDLSKAVNKWMTWDQLERELLATVIQASITVFNTGIVATTTHPEVCHGIKGSYGTQPWPMKLCREWASTWRPQLMHLFADR